MPFDGSGCSGSEIYRVNGQLLNGSGAAARIRYAKHIELALQIELSDDKQIAARLRKFVQD